MLRSTLQQQPPNVRIHTGSLKDLHDTFDLIHFQRPLAMSELDNVIALSKPGACVQTVQFQIKVCCCLFLDSVTRDE